MANQYMDLDTLKYLMFEVQGTDDILALERYQDFDQESVNFLLDSVKAFGDTEAFPVFREMDEQPATYQDGTVVTHPALKKMFDAAGELGLIGGTFDHEVGGLQMPTMVMQAANFILDCANNHLNGYPALASGAARLIASFGSQELKEKYIPNMIAGKWGGTMCLTEPQAGSSLSDITTTAHPQEDGSYRLVGQKIFISGGDQQHTENIIHLVLARIEGAPAGTKGISLFVVPKHRINEDGSTTWNDVTTVADFEKMGQKGYCTTHLGFGTHEDCHGWLVGIENAGLKHMFQMMNEARIGVGCQATGVANAAYHASLQYANERPQGRRLSKDGSKDLSQGQTLIKNHPDVRRMLLLQKAVVEGALSLVLQTTKYQDLHRGQDNEEGERNHILLEMLTPIVKTYPAEKGKMAVDNGLQILGGYGFCNDFVLQQYYRDIRIMAIYEGTTGIQSLDLLGRKVPFKQGEGLRILSQEIMSCVEEAQTYDELKPYAKVLTEQLGINQEILQFLMPFAMQGNHERFLSDATIYMEFFCNIIIGWQWLKIATHAKKSLVTGDTAYTADFYESKIHTMKFFYKYELGKNAGLADVIKHSDVLTLVDDKELVF